MPVSIDGRHWTDRHGPLAFAIVAAIVACALGVTAINASAAMAIVPAVAVALAGMHYGRERARQNRETAKASTE